MRFPPVHAHTRPGRGHTHHHARPGRRGARRGALTVPRRVIGGILAVGLAVLAACGTPALPTLGVVPEFRLTERAGTPLTQADLRGKVWIADFIFTRCPDVCPVLTSRMRDLQKTLDAAKVDVTLVSISVDPGHDTPEVLKAYATAHGAAPGWLFATGERNALQGLLKDGFHVAFADDGPPSGPITHSDRFVLVDPELRIRGYYHGSDPADLQRLADDARHLAPARSG